LQTVVFYRHGAKAITFKAKDLSSKAKDTTFGAKAEAKDDVQGQGPELSSRNIESNAMASRTPSLVFYTNLGTPKFLLKVKSSQVNDDQPKQAQKPPFPAIY